MADTVDLRNEDEERVWPLKLPSLCPTCWGCDHALQFTKEDNDDNCKICDRKFKIVKWSPIPDDKRQTEVCIPCSKLGNICQLCGEICPPKIENKIFPRKSMPMRRLPVRVHVRVLPKREQGTRCRRYVRPLAAAAIVRSPPILHTPAYKSVSTHFQYPY